jgi:3-isopropylmalate dehydrogenase
MQTYHVLFLPGDGVGPEVLAEAGRVLKIIESKRIAKFEISHGLIGGASIDAHGVPLTDETLRAAQNADAVVMGAVGGPKWEKIVYNLRPEQALLSLRREMDLFANLRPAIVYEPLVESSSLRREVVEGLDILFVRELTGGVYFGDPRGIEVRVDGMRVGTNTHVYDSHKIQRVARTAFGLAARRSGKIHSVDKANVMEAGKLWREEVTALHAAEFPKLNLQHMYADNCAMQLLRNPKQFDVILTDNLFGDILSDEAGMLAGSLGMLPSASLGPVKSSGLPAALYEPIHGSAPDIAGQNLANPLATILSLAMMLRYTCGSEAGAAHIENGVLKTLQQGTRTRDIALPHEKVISCSEMTEAVIKNL